jgi:two-component system, cell cycle sensor histidine kinase and response regulator CckA
MLREETVMHQDDTGVGESARIPTVPRGFFETLLEQSTDAIFCADPKGDIVASNRRASEMLGYSRDELQGRHVSELIPAEDLEAGPLHRDLPSGQKRVVRMRRKDGALLEVEFSARVLPDGSWLGVGRGVDERTRSDVSEDKFAKAFRSSPAPMAISSLQDGRFVDVNEALATALGFTRQDLVGKSAVELGVWADPEDRARVVRDLAAEGSVRSRVIRFRAKDARPIPTLYAAEVVDLDGEPCILSVLLDLTERVRAEEALYVSEELLRAILEAAADGILAVDDQGKVVATNRRFADLWRIPPELLLARDDNRLLRFVLDQLQDPEAFLSKVQELYRTRNEDFDTLRFKDGRVFERHSCPLLREGEIRGRVWSFRDVTRRMAAEEERLELERRLLHSQKLESLGVLAGGIAHDFNNLLAAMHGNLELALRDLPAPSPARTRIENALLAATRAADLTRQMLAYSGRGKFAVARVNLSELVEENAHLLRSCVARTVTLNLRLDRSLPCIDADVGQVQQVVMNLITNAAEAVGAQPGVITLTTGVSDCDARYLFRSRIHEKPPAGRYAYVEVTDSGCGMDAETRDRMFDPFYSTKVTGRGLGMATVLGIIRGHGGAILVDSEVGQGTTIRALFPLAEEPATAPTRPSGPAVRREGLPAAAGATHEVLVVDDEEMVRDLAADMFRELGFSVLTASDGREAVEQVRQRGGRIRVVLLDLTMPRMDGAAAMEEILRLEPGVRIILSSGYDEQSVGSHLLRRSQVQFVAKPYSLADLRGALTRALEEEG